MNASSPLHVAPPVAADGVLFWAPRAVTKAFITALQNRFVAHCSTAQAVREQHGRDESSFSAPPPAAVVFAESTADVADVGALASRFDVPVIPWGGGHFARRAFAGCARRHQSGREPHEISAADQRRALRHDA